MTYSTLDRPVSKKSRLVARAIDMLGTPYHTCAVLQLKKFGYTIDCWKLEGQNWVKGS